MRRRGPGAAVVIAAALLLPGCTESAPSDTVTVGPQGGVVSEWNHPTTPAVTFSGATADGGTFDSTQHLGEVVVANFWYAQCGPCRGEAKDLNAVAAGEAGKGVQFVGINVSDGRDEAAAFVKTFAVPYPSIIDQAGGGSVQLAFARNKPPGAIPSTLVLDRKGRVVARIIGAVDRSVLTTLIDDAVDGKAS